MKDIQEFQGVELMLLSQGMKSKTPINGSMELLPLCNMNCDMCYVKLSKDEVRKQGRILSGQEWIAMGEEMLEAGTLFMLLTGGEPLLHPDFKEIYKGLKQMGMILTLNTNATLIDEAWADFFAQNRPRRINITLYGGNEETYEKLCHFSAGFQRVIHAIKLLQERNIDVRIGCSINPSNANDLEEMYRISKELDVPIGTDSYMLPATRERERQFDEQYRLSPEAAAGVRVKAWKLNKGEEFIQFCKKVLEQVDLFEMEEEQPCKSTCLAGNCSFAVNWKGELRPCVITTEPVANVLELGFRRAWDKVGEEFRTLKYCSACSVCSLKSLCSSCVVSVKIETGNYMEKSEYLCRYAKETEKLLRLSLKEYK